MFKNNMLGHSKHRKAYGSTGYSPKTRMGMYLDNEKRQNELDAIKKNRKAKTYKTVKGLMVSELKKRGRR